MDEAEKLISKYLEKKLKVGKDNRTESCLSEQVLTEYLEGALIEAGRQAVEYHLTDCEFCLSQLNIAFESRMLNKQKCFESVPQKLINKTKSLLEIGGESRDKIKLLKKRFSFMGMIFFFILSFIVPRYFIQFLVAAFILGIRWTFESEGGRTLILALNSWRQHSREKDEEIPHRLKKRF